MGQKGLVIMSINGGGSNVFLERQDMMHIAARAAHFRLAVVWLGFFLLFSAYNVVEALQSSLNKAVGTHALTVLYITVTSTSLFLPTLAMEFVKKNKLMGLSVLPYMCLTLANFYPCEVTLMPAAVLVGCGANVIWTATRVYVTDLATQHAAQTDDDRDKVTSKFIGLFFGSVAAALLAGNGASSLLMQYFSHYNITNNSEDSVTRGNAINTEFKKSLHLCGIHNCDSLKNEFYHLSNHRQQEDVNWHVDKTTLYCMLGGFTIIQLIAAVIMYNIKTDEYDARMHTKDGSTVPLIHSDENKTCNQESYQATEPVSLRIRRNAVAAATLYLVHPIAVLLVPYAIHVGMLQGFVMSQVTRDWITCDLGIASVGYGIAIYGVGCIIGSCGFALLSQLVPTWMIVLVDLLMEIASIAMLWRHDKFDTAWMLYLVIGVLGIVCQSLRTANTAIPSIYFPDDKEAALAASIAWECLGKATAFAVSSHICNMVYLILMMTFCSVGVILYFISETINAKRQ